MERKERLRRRTECYHAKRNRETAGERERVTIRTVCETSARHDVYRAGDTLPTTTPGAIAHEEDGLMCIVYHVIINIHIPTKEYKQCSRKHQLGLSEIIILTAGSSGLQYLTYIINNSILPMQNNSTIFEATPLKLTCCILL